jgi:hypothetical protein
MASAMTWTPCLSITPVPDYPRQQVLSQTDTLRIPAENSPIIGSDLAVQYAEVEIGGRAYVCPVRSIATITMHNVKMERIDGAGIERHLNEVQYIDYHKFGATSRVIANP